MNQPGANQWRASAKSLLGLERAGGTAGCGSQTLQLWKKNKGEERKQSAGAYLAGEGMLLLLPPGCNCLEAG
jgi:hypothetical protein